jgi:hypothetical protein
MGAVRQIDRLRLEIDLQRFRHAAVCLLKVDGQRVATVLALPWSRRLLLAEEVAKNLAEDVRETLT